MRQSLVGRLLENLRDNTRHTSVIKFFEIGNIYAKDGERNITVTELLRGIKNLPYAEKKVLA